MLPTVILIFIMAALLVLAFLYSRYRMKRALRDVILIFREKNALENVDAKTKDELGLTPPGLLARMMSQRDYKPYALQLLIGAEVVQVTSEDKYYLSEKNLASSKLQEYAN